ncbi:MAG: hypothetical protein U0871_25920 [Gemmataceae bacterium]
MGNEPRWFHCTTHTYGAWLYGDPRGFRTRHHREHVEGDYKHPPPRGMYDGQLQRSKKLLKQPPVVLSREWRPVVGAALVERLLGLKARLLCLSCGGQHVHFLAQMPPGEVPREWTGLAKKHAWFAARDRGWVGKLWAVRGKVIPISDRRHQLNTYRYILDHTAEGAWVWDFRARPEAAESPPVATGGL